MKVIYDAEFDSLTPTKLWCVVAKDTETEERYVFRFDQPGWERDLRGFAAGVSCWIGVNSLVFDGPNINYLMGGTEVINSYRQLDLLIVSRLVNYAREGGHSVKAWGQYFDMVKPEIAVYDDPKMIEDYVDRCEHDVEIQFRIYKELQRFIDDPDWASSIETEHEIQRIAMEMTEDGFSYDIEKADELLDQITSEMEVLETTMKESIPPVLIKDAVLNLRKKKDGEPYASTIKGVGCVCDYLDGSVWYRFHHAPFNPGSTKQRIELLNRSGWKPVEKTAGHLKCERELAQARRFRNPTKELEERLEYFKIYGWKVNEENLNTLPNNAPVGASSLAEWLSLDARRADLVEWKAAYQPHSGRIHGSFNGIGSWSHRMSHARPNAGNIFRVFYPEQCKDSECPTKVESVKLRFNGVLRGLWRAEPGAYLVGADAEGIQLRVLAHLINDPEYRHTIESGRKEDKTDVHNKNMRSLAPYCLSRDHAKTFIYAWVLNAAAAKLGIILECSLKEANWAIKKFYEDNPALAEFKRYTVPEIAKRRFFVGLDGRKVIVPDEHKTLAGLLQNGEAVIMKHANILWRKWAFEDGLRFKQVNFVHDEWQTEVYDEEVAHRIGQHQCDAIVKVGRELGVRCNLAGEYKIGRNWLETH